MQGKIAVSRYNSNDPYREVSAIPMKAPKVHNTNYRVLQQEGQSLPTRAGFLATQAMMNRVSKRYRAEWKLGIRHLSLLCLVEYILYAKGNDKPIALSTLMRTYGTSYLHAHVQRFIGYVRHMGDVGVLSVNYSGTVKGSNVTITQLGRQHVDDLYKELGATMKHYPEHK